MFGNAFTAKETPAIRAFCGGFTDAVIKTPLFTYIHANSLVENRE
jgi:hypothetical protein